jgi:hypothetical protein
MSSFPTDQVAVTLTGEEWTTITGGLSRHGSRFYRQATAKLHEQLLAASDAAQSAPPAARPPSSLRVDDTQLRARSGAVRR